MFFSAQAADEPRITVQAGTPLHRISPWLAGSCIEDVNHEIYGGLYSQMIFGERFQEPARSASIKDFDAYGGRWTIKAAELWGDRGDGPKLVSTSGAMTDGEVSVDVFLPDGGSGKAGFILNVDKPGIGMDAFTGYEVSLDAELQALTLGRHRQNWEHISDTKCAVPANQWITLAVKMTGATLDVTVNGKLVVQYEDKAHPLKSGAVGLRNWRRVAAYRNLTVKTGGETKTLAFMPGPEVEYEISGMWRLVKRGTAAGKCSLEQNSFLGRQSQRITFASGEGELGIENMGLNRWGTSLVQGRKYEGNLWAGASVPTECIVALESSDGSKIYAEQSINISAGHWKRFEFTLTSNATDPKGRFAIKLKQPGSIKIGHAFLQAEESARFKGLPVRKDVADAMLDAGNKLLRYGGSMVNEKEYRWKNMIGPRDTRPMTHGMWYPYSTNGWGIVDFVQFCEAAEIPGIPAFCMDESPQDMADFVDYMFAPAETVWGKKRAQDGHPPPYSKLKHIELGNEERIDDAYFNKFKALAEAIWPKAPDLILVVGDFAYNQKIVDLEKFGGSESRITTLAAHRKILALAKQHNREVWFDVHIATEGPNPSPSQNALGSYIEALEKIADGAKFKVAVFEFNSNNHRQRRAIGNASAIMTCERLGERLAVGIAANGLQPDGQNDNGWDQGLVFLNPSQVWIQPPGYTMQMVARNYQPLFLKTELQNAPAQLDATAAKSDDGKMLVVKVLNMSDKPITATVALNGFTPAKTEGAAEVLSGGLNDRNTAQDPQHVTPKKDAFKIDAGGTRRTFAPYSFTVMTFE